MSKYIFTATAFLLILWWFRVSLKCMRPIHFLLCAPSCHGCTNELRIFASFFITLFECRKRKLIAQERLHTVLKHIFCPKIQFTENLRLWITLNFRAKNIDFFSFLKVEFSRQKCNFLCFFGAKIQIFNLSENSWILQNWIFGHFWSI